MLYDTEYSMNIYGETGATTDPIGWTRDRDGLFNALCSNTTFRQDISNRLLYIADHNFATATAEAKLDSLAALYRPLMEQYWARFGGAGMFDTRIERMKTFIEGRKVVLQSSIANNF